MDVIQFPSFSVFDNLNEVHTKYFVSNKQLPLHAENISYFQISNN